MISHTIFHERASQSNESQSMSYTLSTYLDCFGAFGGSDKQSKACHCQLTNEGERRKENQ
jgi:hypothetical protein